MQRQRLAQKYRREFLALLDSEVNCKVLVNNIVQKLVVEDEAGNTISKTNGSLVGKIIDVRYKLLHDQIE